ncbi:MAG: hypothetical protein IJ960_08155 [Oscillospiraceae bacterium]|nr:hypothetical protein [Oscillospiraceae bacterium]
MKSAKIAAIAAALFCVTLLSACGPAPVETLETSLPALPVSGAYAKILALEGAEQYDPAVLEAFARRIEEEEGFLETYTEDWTLKQDGTIARLICVAPLTDDYKRATFTLIHDGKSVRVDAVSRREFPDWFSQEIYQHLRSAKNSDLPSAGTMTAFLRYLMECDWFPSIEEFEQYDTKWRFSFTPLPGRDASDKYLTLFISFHKIDGAPDEPFTVHSVYLGNGGIQYRAVEVIEPAPVVTEPPTTVPPTTEPVPTEPTVPFDYENSPAYQKLLTLYNAEDFLCNRFGYNELAIFAEWIDSLEGVTETYSGIWYLTHYGDDGAGLCCHTPLEEDNSCDYMEFFLWYGGDIITAPSTGRRYFTDIPREDISALIYGAYDPIGVDNRIRERMIEQALVDEHFAWNVMDPEFKILDSYYEIRRYWPYPEYEPDNYVDEIYLVFHVWQPGMGEDEYVKCWLSYDEELKRVFYGSDVDYSEWLSGIIPKD